MKGWMVIIGHRSSKSTFGANKHNYSAKSFEHFGFYRFFPDHYRVTISLHLKDNIDVTCDIGIEKKSLKKIDPVGSNVRYEIMKLCTGSV